MIFLIVLLIIIIAALALSQSKDTGHLFEPESRKAGRFGEQAATNVIQTVLRDGDHLFTNVKIKYKDKPTELDNVVVNKYGVFIIEVKNYSGRLCGKEDEFEWEKYKTTSGGITYKKTVKNPIKQVKRQTYILAKYLEDHGCRVWVEGKAFLLQGNSPVNSQYVLNNAGEINRAIHTFGKNHLDEKKIAAICKLLS